MATKTAAVSPVDHVRKAIDELDEARAEAGQQARERIDSTIDRLRELAGDLSTRMKDQAGEFQDMLESAPDDLRLEFGRRVVRAQRTPEALTALAGEVRRRKAELTA